MSNTVDSEYVRELVGRTVQARLFKLVRLLDENLQSLGGQSAGVAGISDVVAPRRDPRASACIRASFLGH